MTSQPTEDSTVPAGAYPEPARAGSAPDRARRLAARQRRWSGVLANGLIVLVLLGWWWGAQRTTDFILPPPAQVLRQATELFWGDMWHHTAWTFARVTAAVVLSMLLGGLAVLGTRLVPVTERVVSERIQPFLNSMPALGWAIVGVTWFGVGNRSVVLIEVAILMPFAMVNLTEGLRALDRDLLEMGRSFTRRASRVLWRIELPLLLPYLFAAARLAFGVGFKVALIAEFFGAETGLGLVMNRARQTFNTSLVYATIFTVVFVVYVIERFGFDPLGRLVARRAGAGKAAAAPAREA